MNIKTVLASKLETNQQTITGKLQGNNCRGKEKVKRLQEIFGDKNNYFLYAYGDSLGDKELLEYADVSFYKPF